LDKSMGGVQVASYRAETDEGLFVRQIYYLGYYYNYAMLAPECNFSSYPTMKLQEMGYMNMYVREAVDTYTARITKKFGFRTNSQTRPLIIDMLNDVIRDRIDLINDEDFLKESLSFIKNDKGRPEAAEGAHDDCVMAMAIAFYCMPQAHSTGYSQEETEDDDAPVENYSDFIAYGG
jgi:phage terminase large subunit